MKRNFVLILGVIITVVTLMLMGNIIFIGEKLVEICHTPIVEYIFYVLILLLALIFIIRPVIRVRNAPEFPVLSVDADAQVKQMQDFGKRLASNCSYIPDEDMRKEHQMLFRRDLQLFSADREQLKNVLSKEIARRFDGDEALGVLGIEKRITQWGKNVFMVTAISQNSFLDSAAVMVMNYKLIEDIVLSTGFRPTRPQMVRLYARVLSTSLISYFTSQVMTEMDLSPELGGEDLTGMKIPGVMAESALQGAVNALMTMRIGYVTKIYLQEGPQALTGVQNKRRVRVEAIKSAFKSLPSIVAGSASTLGKGVTGLVARMVGKE